MEQMFNNQLLNNQLITMMSLKENVSIYQIFISIFMMNAIQYIPIVKKYVSEYLKKQIDLKKKNITIFKDSESKKIESSITFIQKKANDNIIFNAINYYIVNHNNSKNLRYYNEFSVINEEKFILDENYECIVNNVGIDEDENKIYNIEILSYTKTLKE